MSVGFAYSGVFVNEVDTSPRFALGTEHVLGGTTYRYVVAASAIAAGDAVVLSVTHAEEPNAVAPCSAANQPIAGVAHVAIPNGNYGWIIVRGRVPAGKVASGTAANAQLGSSSTSGTLSTISVGASYSQSEVQRVLAAAAGRAVIALDAEAGGTAELFIY